MGHGALIFFGSRCRCRTGIIVASAWLMNLSLIRVAVILLHIFAFFALQGCTTPTKMETLGVGAVSTHTYGSHSLSFHTTSFLSPEELKNARLVVPNEIVTGYGPNLGSIPLALFQPSLSSMNGERIVSHVVVPDADGRPILVTGFDGTPMAVMDCYGTTGTGANRKYNVFLDRRVFVPPGALRFGSIAPRLLLGTAQHSEDGSPSQALPAGRDYMDLNGVLIASYRYLANAADAPTSRSPHRRMVFVGTPGAGPYTISSQDFTIDLGTYLRNAHTGWYGTTEAEADTLWPNHKRPTNSQLVLIDSVWATYMNHPNGFRNHDRHQKSNFIRAYHNRASAFERKEVDTIMYTLFRSLHPALYVFTHASHMAYQTSHGQQRYARLFTDVSEYGAEDKEEAGVTADEVPTTEGCDGVLSAETLRDLKTLGLTPNQDGTLPSWSTVRNAYNQWIKAYHPDRFDFELNTTADPSRREALEVEKQQAEAYFKEHWNAVNDAKERLKQKLASSAPPSQ